LQGVQRGTKSFVKSVSMETMHVTTKIAMTAQSLLESIDDVLSPEPATVRVQKQREKVRRAKETRNKNKPGSGSNTSKNRSKRTSTSTRSTTRRASVMEDQPGGLEEGLRQAYDSLTRGLQIAAHGLVAVPREEYQQHGTKGAIKSVIKGVPGAILRPMIGVTEAVSKTLIGVQNTMDPLQKKDSKDRYKGNEK